MDSINDSELKEEISPNDSALALEIEAHIPENTSSIERQSNSTNSIANNKN